MAGGYDDRDGMIWLDGKMVPWRDANVHILTHAIHYASSVFEGERAYGGTIFESRRHSERLRASASMIDFEIPWTVDEIEAAKYEVMKANGLSDAYVRAIAWRGAGEDMGVASARNPVRMAIAAWTWGNYYGDAKTRGAKLDIEATGANIFFVKDGEVHTPLPDCFLNGITRQTVVQMLRDRQIPVHERHIMPEELEGFQQCWLTGTAAEVTPVGQIGDYNFEVGEMARDISDAYEKRVRA